MLRSQDKQIQDVALVLLGYNETEASFMDIKDLLQVKYNIHMYVQIGNDYSLGNIKLFYLGDLKTAIDNHNKITKEDGKTI